MKITKKIKYIGIGILVALSTSVLATAIAEWKGTEWIADGSIISADKIKSNFDYLYERSWNVEDGKMTTDKKATSAETVEADSDNTLVTKGYVDSSGGGVLPLITEGYSEKFWNFDEDVYGKFAVGGYGVSDTCDNENTTYACSKNENRNCIDIKVENRRDSKGYVGYKVVSKRTIRCIAAKILVKNNNSRYLTQAFSKGYLISKYQNSTTCPGGCSLGGNELTSLKLCKEEGFTEVFDMNPTSYYSPSDNWNQNWNGSSWIIQRAGYSTNIGPLICKKNI